MILAVRSMWQREIVRFLRDRSRLTGSLMQPIVFWLLFSGALARVDMGGGQGYASYFFAGTLAMISLFTAIFATITVIEDRKDGFLQGVLVSPVPRSAIALGKILGGATLGTGLGTFFLAIGAVAGMEVTLATAIETVGVLLLLSVAVTGLGFALAWVMDSTAGYHGIMMLFLMPMLLLSGAFFPMNEAHELLAWIRWVNPMTYGVGALRHALASPPEVLAALPGYGTCLAASAGFALATFVLGTAVVNRRSARNAA